MDELEKVNIVKTFKIDCSKVKTVEDVVAVFKSMDIHFWIRTEEIPEKFKEIIDKGIANNDLPTKEGTKVLSNVFIQGLVGNIHQGHENGFWNDVEHLKYIISELEKGFAAVANVGTSTF
jgi:hypothetical protein